MATALQGVRIVEMAGIGPGPYAAMMLADHGADVLRVERIGGRPDANGATKDPLLRSRPFIQVDLKSEEGVALVRDLSRNADALIEGFRPGVMERLGLGPDVLHADHPGLVYGRMTGWGQDGPLAQAAGHDINYIAITGTLSMVGRAGERPLPPLNLAGDFGGGAMMLAFGMLAALVHVRSGGKGQVIDCAMSDGSALLSAMMWGFYGQGLWRDARGTNILDGGAHFYDSYECADGGWIAVGPIEPQFFSTLAAAIGCADLDKPDRMDSRQWASGRERLAAVFKTRTRDAWAALLEGSDACVSPILSMAEAPSHPHNVARGTFVEAGGIVQPAPVPRYSGLETVPPRMRAPGSALDEALGAIGYDQARIDDLRARGVAA